MARLRVYQFRGLGLKTSPLLESEGNLLRCVNMDPDPIGGLRKRPGYVSYLGSHGSQIDSLFEWHQNDGSTFWTYAAAGGSILYSTQGTGAWTICGNGTMTSGTHIGTAYLENTMIIGDGVVATRHTTNGTSLTNTPSAPIAPYFTDYQNRIYAGGTASSLFYSNVGTPSDWTNDSSSITIPGPGKISAVYKSQDRLVASKNSGVMHRWDGYNLFDMSTELGPSSYSSLGAVEGFKFGLNRLGFFAYTAGVPQLLSNQVERQIYNDRGSGIIGTTFDNAPGVLHKYNYYCTVGTITDDLTNETVEAGIMVYNFQQDYWRNYKFAHRPTAWLSYKDVSGSQQLIFGDGNGQCYTLGGTALSDNGAAIACSAEGVLNFGDPESEKDFNTIWAFFSPGSGAKFQVAPTDSFSKWSKKWIDLGDTSTGIVEFNFPSGSRGRLLSWRVSESSRESRFTFYGFSVDYDTIPKK